MTELIELARKELAWCEQEMVRASREMGLGDNWHAALDKVKNDFVEPGKQPELVRRLAQEAVDYVTQRNLVTVPPLAREDWWQEMLTPEQQRRAILSPVAPPDLVTSNRSGNGLRRQCVVQPLYLRL